MSLPNAILINRAQGFWFWTAAQIQGGHRAMAEPLRRAWIDANLGIWRLTMASAWIDRA